MSLAPILSNLRPGGPVSPAGVPAAWHLSFLSAEAESTHVLQSFYKRAQNEIEAFLRTGDISASDATFYRNLLDEVNRVGSSLDTAGATWTSKYIPSAYQSAWRTHSSLVVNDRALDALSRDTLGMITQMNDDMRRQIRGVIGAGILEGQSGADLRQRLLQSGMKNIPHWPSTDYRAGVIARTETMRAYNGGALNGMKATGARFAEWIASPDEATCPICLPRDGKVYRLSAGDVAGTGVDPFGPAVGPLPDIPAHPRCRCTIRARYRDQNGNVISSTKASRVPPELQPGEMGYGKAPELPASAGDFQKALGGLPDDLTEYYSGSLQGGARQDFWRGLGQFDEGQIQALSALKGQAGDRTTEALLRLRYGIKFGSGTKYPTGYGGDVRAAMIRALERLRAMNPDFVVDSKYLKVIGDRPFGAKKFGPRTLGRAYVTGEVEVKGSANGIVKYAGKKGAKIRAGAEVDGADEIWTHEFFHTIHNRFGTYDRDLVPRLGSGSWAKVEAVGVEWHNEWEAIRAVSHGVAPDVSDVTRLRAAVESLRAKVASPDYAYAKTWNEKRLVQTRQQLREVEAIVNGGTPSHEYYPTAYGKSDGIREDFAESGMLYLLNPSRLRKFSPLRYKFFKTQVFGGKSPP